MRKTLFFLITILVFLLLPSIVGAKAQEVQNQNQVQTQNQGEEQGLQVATQEQEGQEEENDRAKEPKKESPRSQVAREYMSLVAQKVEELLIARTVKGGIGEQVREVAKEQQVAQGETQEELEKLENRQGLWKKLFGPNYQAIKNLKRQREHNEERIRLLEQLKNQVVNQAEANQIAETTEALTQLNNSLQEQIEAEEDTQSLFGWLFRLLAQ